MTDTDDEPRVKPGRPAAAAAAAKKAAKKRVGRAEVVLGSVRRRWRRDAPAQGGVACVDADDDDDDDDDGVEDHSPSGRYGYSCGGSRSPGARSPTRCLEAGAATPCARGNAASSIRYLKKVIRANEAHGHNINVRGKKCVVGKGMWELDASLDVLRGAPPRRRRQHEEWAVGIVLAGVGRRFMDIARQRVAVRILETLFYPIARKWLLFRMSRQLRAALERPRARDLQAYSFFHLWPPEALEGVVPHVQQQAIRAGRSVYLYNDPLVYVYILREGTVEVSTRRDASSFATTVCGTLRAGSVLGDPYNHNCGPATLSLWALTDVLMYCIPTCALASSWSQLPPQCTTALQRSVVSERLGFLETAGFVGRAVLERMEIFRHILRGGAMVVDRLRGTRTLHAAREAFEGYVVDALTSLFVPGVATPGEALPTAGKVVYITSGRADRVQAKKHATPIHTPVPVSSGTSEQLSPHSVRSRLSGTAPGSPLGGGFSRRSWRGGGAIVATTATATVNDDRPGTPNAQGSGGASVNASGAGAGDDAMSGAAAAGGPTTVNAGTWINDSAREVLGSMRVLSPPASVGGAQTPVYAVATVCEYWWAPQAEVAAILREHPSIMECAAAMLAERRYSLEDDLDAFLSAVSRGGDPPQTAPPCTPNTYRKLVSESLNPKVENVKVHLPNTRSFRLLQTCPNPNLRSFTPGARVVTSRGFKGVLVEVNYTTAMATVQLELGGTVELQHVSNLRVWRPTTAVRSAFSYRAAQVPKGRPKIAQGGTGKALHLGNSSRAQGQGRMDFMNWK